MEPKNNLLSGKLYRHIHQIRSNKANSKLIGSFKTWLKNYEGKYGSHCLSYVEALLAHSNNAKDEAKDKFVNRGKFHSDQFPDFSNPDKKGSQVQGKIMDALYDFLAIEELLANSTELNRFKIKALSSNQLQEFLPSVTKKYEQKLSYDSPSDFQLSLESKVLSYGMQIQKGLRSSTTPAQPVLNAINDQFIHWKLKYACVALNHDQILNTQHQFAFLPSILNYVTQHYDRLPDLIRVYYHLFEALNSPHDPRVFLQFETILHNSQQSIILTERKELAIFFQNYCIRRNKQGDIEFGQKLEEHYKVCLSDGLLLNEQGTISANVFKNIIYFMADRGQVEWVKKFGKEYIGKIHGEDHQGIGLYFEGIVHFYSREFRKAWRCFDKILGAYGDIFIGLDARSMSVKSLFELGEWAMLELALDSFRNFVNRNKKIPKARREIFLSFIKRLNRLVSILQSRPDKVQEKLNTLFRSFNEDEKMTFRWLIEKIKEQLDQDPE